MKAYRIGKKAAGPWVNTTPPIRGGIYLKEEASPAGTVGYLSDTEEDVADDVSSWHSNQGSSSETSDTSECSSVTSLEKAAQPGMQAGIRSRAPILRDEAARKLEARSRAARYTNWAVNREIDQALEDYPSLDPAMQQDIVRKYRLLHQRVYDEGFYDCPYLEYGKEMIRYVSLFVAFLLALRHGWYIVSAVFLGLFWVRWLDPTPSKIYALNIPMC